MTGRHVTACRSVIRSGLALACTAAIVTACTSDPSEGGDDPSATPTPLVTSTATATDPATAEPRPSRTPAADDASPSADGPSPSTSATGPDGRPAWATPAPGWTPGQEEVLVEAKTTAARVVEQLTTYGPDEGGAERRRRVAGDRTTPASLATADALDHTGAWSRGRVVYPQMGGLAEGAASVMVVVEQIWGDGGDAPTAEVRTVDVRLRRADPDSAWVLDRIASVGGQPVAADGSDVVDHPVLRDERVVLPDSARWDILAGRIDPRLLDVMSDIGEQFPVDVAVLQSGHPLNVFATDRRSAHTDGRAVDLIVVDGATVVSSHQRDSATRALVEWLYEDPRVTVIGSPWALDDVGGRSFTDLVHDDHIHVSVLSSDEEVPTSIDGDP